MYMVIHFLDIMSQLCGPRASFDVCEENIPDSNEVDGCLFKGLKYFTWLTLRKIWRFLLLLFASMETGVLEKWMLILVFEFLWL